MRWPWFPPSRGDITAIILIKFDMDNFKLGCAILALVYLATPILVPNSLNLWNLPNVAYALIFAISAYGTHTRKLIFWKIIPFLLVAYVLIEFAGLAAWSLSSHQHPLGGFAWIPLVVYLVSLCVVLFWWRNQRLYFEK